MAVLSSGRKTFGPARRFEERDAEICRLYRAKMPMEFIGAAHGVTRQRIQQIVARAGIHGRSLTEASRTEMWAIRRDRPEDAIARIAKRSALPPERVAVAMAGWLR